MAPYGSTLQSITISPFQRAPLVRKACKSYQSGKHTIEFCSARSKIIVKMTKDDKSMEGLLGIFQICHVN